MSLELYSAEVKTIEALWTAWETKRDYELEATFTPLDYTALLNIINHLRKIGLQEIPNAPKLNIIIGDVLRFTLEGEDVIQQYCKDNTLVGKPFTVTLKEKKMLKSVASEVDIKEYGMRIKLRRELDLRIDDSRVQDALKKWSTLPKAFRHIKRYSFLSSIHKGIQFDASFIRENIKDARGSYVLSTSFTGAQIHKQDVKYEMEIEAIRKDSPLQKSFLMGCTMVLRGLQKSHILTRLSVKNDVIRFMATKTGISLKQERGGRLQGFPGAKPVTLRKEHIGLESEAEQPNIRLGDYNVTDKADGLRCLLVVVPTGNIFLIDPNLNVYGTDRYLEGDDAKKWAGVVLDGEWVTQSRDDLPISHYYAFDIFNGPLGEDVTPLPFVVRGDDSKHSRHTVLSETIAALSNAKSKPTPKQNLSIFMKSFQWAKDPKDPKDTNGIFREASSVLDRVKADAPYHTDGLIFTPNADSLPKNGRTWNKQFKWKPADMNSVDFLVVLEKEQNTDGKPTNVDYVQFLEKEPGKIVRCKTLHLYAGSSIDPLRIDPRDTILQKKPLPTSDKSTGPYRPVEFSVTPTDPFASICRVEIPAGAEDNIFCAESSDPINDKTIVEMVYKPENMPGWRWSPMRVRWDKTELFARGEVGRTMNDISVATDVWNSIHDPITETMIRTGNMANDSLGEAKPATYYKRKAGQDRYITGGMTSFHNQYIKDRVLLSSTLTPGSALIDMSVGRAGDLHKWLGARVGWVLGCDISLAGLVEKDGAYDRYLTQAIQRRGAVPKMLFVNADSSKRYSDGSAGLSEMDSDMLKCVWGEEVSSPAPLVADLAGKAKDGFDVASSMFALHYFFKDVDTLEGVLTNISESVKVGGYFVGCCTDGDQVAKLLKGYSVGDSVSGSEGDKLLWKIKKQYDNPSEFLPSDESGLGYAIDVNFISIGDTHTEYLVSWEYLKSRMAENGFDLLNDDELRAKNLVKSTNLFEESYEMAKKNGLTYGMPVSLQQFSFLSRWFIFKRRAMDSSFEHTAPALPAVPASVPSVLSVPSLQEAAPVVEQAAGAEVSDTVPFPNEIVNEEEEIVEQSGSSHQGPIYQFYHKSKPKDEIKVGDKNWRRVLSTYAPFKFRDIKNPDIEYSSLEAAIGSAKFQYATNRPELGPQLFSVTGNIHQETLQSKDADYDEEGSKMRLKQKPAEIKKCGAKYKPLDWLEKQEEVIHEYLKQRFQADDHFKKILEAVAKQHAKLVYYAPNSDDLGGTIEGNRIEGNNILGNLLMKLV